VTGIGSGEKGAGNSRQSTCCLTRLADRGIAGISKSSWNRYSVRKAILFREREADNKIITDLHATLGSDMPQQVTMVVAEMLKLRVFRNLEDGEANEKALSALSRTLRNAVQAQIDHVELQSEEHALKEKLEKVGARVETIAREAGLPADRIAEMRREFLGVKPKQTQDES
jgi:restriction endonuclease Mrr